MMAYHRIGVINMIECDCLVTPDQPWNKDGTADVVLLESCNLTGGRNLPLKHFPPKQEVIISKTVYPKGLVVVPTEGYPEEIPAKLPCKISSEDTIILRKQDWPYGAVGMFIEI